MSLKTNALLAAGAFTLLLSGVGMAATSQIDYVNTATTVKNNAGVALSPGGNANFDGAVIQIGYFSTSTATFQGTWIPITGQGSANTGLLTSIGDGGDATTPGIFSGSVVFSDTLAGTANNLPPAGTQLAIRFFSGTTVAGSTHYNTVTSSEWTFVALATPAPLPELMDMDSAPLVWQDANGAFRTSIVIIPEASSLMLGLVGGVFLLRRRR